jgi:biopolymer transport protein ExbB/TolQ/uncharacterized protein (DUF305 family)
MFSRKSSKQNFVTSLWTSIWLGCVIASAFYALVEIGVFTNPILIRYVMGHPVCVATVYLYAIATVALTIKLSTALKEPRRTKLANTNLLDLMQSIPNEKPIERVRWLDSMWKVQEATKSHTYFGSRFAKVLRRLIQRNNLEQIDNDLQELADEDSLAQHEDYSVIRIICWAMPMLGFLGTVVGLSQTLGSMDMKLLASGDPDAMKSLTGGLYVAFDTTAIGLILTILVMFMQFIVSGFEMRVLREIDGLLVDRCFSLVKTGSGNDDKASQDEIGILAKVVIESTSSAIAQLLDRQTSFWTTAMDKADHRWTTISNEASEVMTASLQRSLSNSLENFAKEVHKAQVSTVSALEARHQQWQTTLSDQSRNLAACQEAMSTQCQSLNKLVEDCQGFKVLDDTIQQTLTRMTDVDRFHEAAVCMTEAIAVLGIQLERSGQIGKMVRNTPPRADVLNLFDNGDQTRDAA